jgi:hypothetical protein
MSHSASRIIRKSDDFYLASEYNLVVRPFTHLPCYAERVLDAAYAQTDIGLCAYTDLLRTVSGFHVQAYSDPNSRTGLNKVRKSLRHSTNSLNSLRA